MSELPVDEKDAPEGYYAVKYTSKHTISTVEDVQ